MDSRRVVLATPVASTMPPAGAPGASASVSGPPKPARRTVLSAQSSHVQPSAAPYSPNESKQLHTFAHGLEQLGRLDEALPLYRCLFPPSHPLVVSVMSRLASQEADCGGAQQLEAAA